MSTYVLVHGAWQGAWSWKKPGWFLRRTAHTVVAPDLPAHGEDTTPIADVTLDSYVARVCEVLDAQSEPVILVGHSSGGVVITQAAERRPDAVSTLVYVAAFLPANGQSLMSLAEQDPESLLLPNLVTSKDGHSVTIKDDVLEEAFYADCSDTDIAWAKSLLVPEPTAPLSTPVETSADNFGRIRRLYIECLQDRAISPALQRKMYEAQPCDKVISMDTGHAPFFAAPGKLGDHLQFA